MALAGSRSKAISGVTDGESATALDSTAGSLWKWIWSSVFRSCRLRQWGRGLHLVPGVFLSPIKKALIRAGQLIQRLTKVTTTPVPASRP